MPSSRHRLTLTERTQVVETYALAELEDKYIRYHQAQGHSKSAIARHQSTQKLLRRFLEETRRKPTSQQLTTAVMQQFAVWLQETPVKPRRGSTTRSIFGVHAHLRDLRAYTRWLTTEGYLTEPVKVPLPRLPEMLFPILSQEELERVWQSRYLTGHSGLAVRNRAMIGLMLDTGLRRSEIARLSVKDVDLFNCQLSVTGKGGKQRRVPFASSVRALLEAWRVTRGDAEGTLFGIASQTIKTMFARIRQDVGLDIFHPHQLRHQAATMLVRNNADLETVSRILGHAELETTRKYLSLSDEDLRTKHAAASPFDALMRLRQPEPAAPKRRRLSLVEP